MSLKQVYCQDKAIGILQRALAAQRLAHAYIFSGSDGVGRFKTAYEFSKMLLCKTPVREADHSDSCGSCESCVLFEAGSHPDFNPVYKELTEFTKKGKGKKTPVDLPIAVIREFLIAKVSARPTLSEKKVFVVSEAEKLNAASQNSLLKVLEEPPAYCCIIMICTSMEKLLPTTRSRCQLIRFGPIDEDKIIDKLGEMGMEKEKAKYFARLSQGSLGTACQWAALEQADANLYQCKRRLISSLAAYQYRDSLNLAQQFLDDSKKIAAVFLSLSKDLSKTDITRRAHKTVIRMIISALQDAMKLEIMPGENITNFDQPEQIKKLAERFSPEQAAEKIALCHTAMQWIDSSVNEKLIFEQLLLTLAISDIIRV